MTRFFLLLLCLAFSSAIFADSEEEGTFSNVEIRVIRPRYFIKEHTFELGIGTGAITNYDMLYVYLLNLKASYHFSEKLGLEFNWSYGVSQEKADKGVLSDRFSIDSGTIGIADYVLLGMMWTPIYGKFQSSSGEVYYFDTFLALGGGTSGFEYKGCNDSPVDGVISFPSFYSSLGQRYFLSKHSSFNLRFDMVGALSSDTACNGQSPPPVNLNVGIGYSIFL